MTKHIERMAVVARLPGVCADDGCIVGTRYGQWPHGRTFGGNRCVDRYVVKNGLVTQMEVWHDGAEWLLRAGLARL